MQKQKGRTRGALGAILSKIPAVSRLLDSRSLAPVLRRHGSHLVTGLLREHLDRLRREIREGRLDGAGLRDAMAASTIARCVDQAACELLAPRPRHVINATGVVVHTNLGRSTLSEAASDAVAAAASGYLDLEYDAGQGRRGNRQSHLSPLMERLFPGQGFAVVNNNAAAIMICLRALSKGKDALVSRGELVEIGGSFRVPDIMSVSGAKLREVGTTNRTRVADYESEITAKTGMVLKVHTSNFRIVGFAEEASVDELAALARRADVPLVVDWGSGDLVDLGPIDIHDESPVSAILEQGADLVTFSGDKLLGGPQAGFIVGREDLIQRVRRDPMMRICRLDRLRLGALNATLASYVSGRAFEEVPTLRMLAATPEEIERRARKIKREVAKRTGLGKLLDVVDGVSRTGGGSSPTGERPTRLLSVAGPHGDAAPVERHLRAGQPPIVGRIQDGRLLLDLRTVRDSEAQTLCDRLAEALAEVAGGAARRG